jgi:hypothetical protein
LGVVKYNWIRNVRFSDHKPVVAEFIFNIPETNNEKEKKSKNRSNTTSINSNLNPDGTGNNNKDDKSQACVIF